MAFSSSSSFSSATAISIAAVLAVALVVANTRLAEAQSDCVSKLLPCANYLNSTSPSTECCQSMKEVVETQLACLCGLLKNQASLGINMTQALELPKYCNLSSDTSACNAALAPNPSSIPPPAVPGGNSGNGAGHMISWMGMPALVFASALAFFY